MAKLIKAEPIQVNARDIHKGFILHAGYSYKIIIHRHKATVEVIEAEDVLFRTNSALFLPFAIPKDDAQEGDSPMESQEDPMDEQVKVSGLAVIGGLFRYYQLCMDRGNAKHLLICGHTDTAGRESYEEGAELFENGEYSQAAIAFRKAYEIKPSWKILYNIAQCETAAGQYGRALEDFKTFLAQGADEIELKRRNEVEAELDRLRKLVGFVEIKAPDGAKVVINGEERGTCPLAGKLMVAASVVHKLKIVYDAEELLNRNIQVGGTQSITIEANDESDDSRANESSDTSIKTELVPENELASPSTSRRSPLKIAGIITAGVAAH
ncbi:MAG: hypothetical protein JXR76_17340 [Deltaproteobacteria bacterium]|nr:hypothetical protein [Deltaproteobacteria bacterium]